MSTVIVRNETTHYKKIVTLLDVPFPQENNARLPPVSFHQHSPLHTLRGTNISVKLNRVQCKQRGFVS